MAKNERGFSLVEIILAIVIFGLLSAIVVSSLIYGRESTSNSGQRSRAAELAGEGLTAVRNIASPGYTSLSAYQNGVNYYLDLVSNRWALVTTPNSVDNTFTRTIIFSDGPNGSRKITVNVSWKANVTRTSNVAETTYVANWQAATPAPEKTGLLVYANGSTTNDKMSYQTFGTVNAWSDPANLPDVDSGSTNRVARSVKLYTAQTGDTKMVMSRHYDGSKQYVYGTYWNGTSFNTPQLMSQWSSTDWLDAGNFGGCFLADGSFITVYMDGTSSPKWRKFNGSTWSSQGSLNSLGTNDFPTSMAVKCRPGTNEAMVAILSYAYDTSTSFYANGAWSDYTKHGVNSANNRHMVDFDWSPVDPTKGGLLYSNNVNDKSLRMRIFTADGQGSGSWNPVTNAPTQPVTLGSVMLSVRTTGAVEFMACDKDTDTTPDIYCYKNVPEASGFTTPANNHIATTTDPGAQLSFGTGYEVKTGNTGLIAYSDNTNNLKLKLYNSSTETWSASPIAAVDAAATIQKTKVLGRNGSNDSMILAADANRNLYSVMYNGTANTLYTSPAGKAWLSHEASGPSNQAIWFDFGWDN